MHAEYLRSYGNVLQHRHPDGFEGRCCRPRIDLRGRVGRGENRGLAGQLSRPSAGAPSDLPTGGYRTESAAMADAVILIRFLVVGTLNVGLTVVAPGVRRGR